MKIQRKIIEIDEGRCDGCGQCVPACREGAIVVVGGKARLAAEKYCDGLGACLGNCPRGALTIVKSEAEEFDEEAVHEVLKSKERNTMPVSLPRGCPSAQVQSFSTASSCPAADQPLGHTKSTSALSHWPVQIRLVPPSASFLKGAHLLVVADCTPVAYPRFHQDFLKGKVVLVGCPKFDDQEAYVQKFAAIFKNASIRSITAVVMEVPCCQGLPVIVQKGMEIAGAEVPMEKIVVSIRGEVMDESD